MVSLTMSERTNCSNTELLDGFLLFENTETSFDNNIWFQYLFAKHLYCDRLPYESKRLFIDILSLIIILSVFTMLEVIPRLGSVS